MLIVPKSIYIETLSGYLLNLNQVAVFKPAKYPSDEKFYYAQLPDGSLIPLSKGDYEDMMERFDELHTAYGINDEYCGG